MRAARNAEQDNGGRLPACQSMKQKAATSAGTMMKLPSPRSNAIHVAVPNVQGRYLVVVVQVAKLVPQDAANAETQ